MTLICQCFLHWAHVYGFKVVMWMGSTETKNWVSEGTVVESEQDRVFFAGLI